jgi:hypothetical protein
MSEVDPTHRIFVSYIDKSREFYLARGYGNPYRWAHNEDVPFTPLAKSLIKSRVALITTAALPGEKRSLIEVYAAPTVPPPVALFTDHRSWHKEATHTRDVESFLTDPPPRRVRGCRSHRRHLAALLWRTGGLQPAPNRREVCPGGSRPLSC